MISSLHTFSILPRIDHILWNLIFSQRAAILLQEICQRGWIIGQTVDAPGFEMRFDVLGHVVPMIKSSN